MLDLGVQFRADQDGEPRDVEPQQQNDDAAHCTVGGVVVREVREVKLEGERDDEPEQCADHGARRDPRPVLFGIGCKVIDQTDRSRYEHEGQRPLQNLPRPFECRPQSK